jgi:Glycosyl hydrolases family 32 C terminal
VGNARAAIPRGAEKYSLQLYLDKCVLEAFVNDGDAAIYTTLDAGPRDLGIAVTAAESSGRGGRTGGPPPGTGRGSAAGGKARIESLTAWPMKPAVFSLEHFRL